MVRLTDRPDMTLDVYRGRKTTKQQQQQKPLICFFLSLVFAPDNNPLEYHWKFQIIGNFRFSADVFM